MSKILVTGAGGYIGSITLDLLLARGFEVIGIDNFSKGFKKPLELLKEKYDKRFHYYDLDLVTGNLEKVINGEQIEAVIHFAAFCSVGESEKYPVRYFQNNVVGSLNLINSILACGIDKLVFSSSCAVYGQSEYLPIDEIHPQEPLNPYGESKKITEEMLKWFSMLTRFNYVALRYFNVTGASVESNFGDSKKPSIHLIQNAVRSALGLSDFVLSFPEVNTPDKSPIRDYIDVVDLGKAHIKALDYLLDGGKSEAVNLGTGQGNSVLEIIDIIEDITGTKLDVKTGEQRKGDPANLIASIKKANTLLNWKPERSLAESVNSLISWYKKYPNGWEY